jgi:hypothetical protein
MGSAFGVCRLAFGENDVALGRDNLPLRTNPMRTIPLPIAEIACGVASAERRTPNEQP